MLLTLAHHNTALWPENGHYYCCWHGSCLVVVEEFYEFDASEFSTFLAWVHLSSCSMYLLGVIIHYSLHPRQSLKGLSTSECGNS